MVNIKTFTDFDTKLNEHLIDETEAYEYAMNINYNPTGIPGIGSVYFYIVVQKLHIQWDAFLYLKKIC